MAEEKTGILHGFKEFVMRGNVIDLAVGRGRRRCVHRGGQVVQRRDHPTGPRGRRCRRHRWVGLLHRRGDPCTAESATFVDFGAVIAVLVITFVITMAVVYFVFVLPMNKARELATRRSRPREVGP